MRTAIFIRTYSKDIKWLVYSLQSIHKFCTGFGEIVICIPQAQEKLLRELNLTRERIVTCPDYSNDYIGQQVTKLSAFNYTDCDRILYVDSDVLFTTPTTPEDFIKEGKIWMYKTKYTRDRLGDGMCWKERTERAFGEPVEFEYMRRMPLMYWRSTLQAVWKYMFDKGTPIDVYAPQQPGNEFSEFNLLGAYAEKYEQDKYLFLDTDGGVHEPARVRQFWSWGGLTEEAKSEINKILT